MRLPVLESPLPGAHTVDTIARSDRPRVPAPSEAFGSVISELKEASSLRQEFAAPPLATQTLGGVSDVITTVGLKHDLDELRAFGRAQGLSEAALGHLFGVKSPEDETAATASPADTPPGGRIAAEPNDAAIDHALSAPPTPAATNDTANPHPLTAAPLLSHEPRPGNAPPYVGSGPTERPPPVGIGTSLNLGLPARSAPASSTPPTADTAGARTTAASHDEAALDKPLLADRVSPAIVEDRGDSGARAPALSNAQRAVTALPSPSNPPSLASSATSATDQRPAAATLLARAPILPRTTPPLPTGVPVTPNVTGITSSPLLPAMPAAEGMNTHPAVATDATGTTAPAHPSREGGLPPHRAGDGLLVTSDANDLGDGSRPHVLTQLRTLDPEASPLRPRLQPLPAPQGSSVTVTATPLPNTLELPAHTAPDESQDFPGHHPQLRAAPVSMPSPQISSTLSLGSAARDVNELGDRLTERIGERLLAHIQRGQWHVRLHLTPASLGDIDVRLQLQGNEVQATFSASSLTTRDLLLEGLPRLREYLDSSGMEVASLNVDSAREQGRDGKPTHPLIPTSDTNAGHDEPVTGTTSERRDRPGNTDNGWDVFV